MVELLEATDFTTSAPRLSDAVASLLTVFATVSTAFANDPGADGESAALNDVRSKEKSRKRRVSSNSLRSVIDDRIWPSSSLMSFELPQRPVRGEER